MWRALIVLLLLATTARAEPPRVVTSIAPLQGIVADVMAGVAEPELLLSDNTSPHDFALRPSQLRALGQADVVFYIGLDMEPWLIKPLAQQDALAIALGEAASPHKLAIRDLQDFGGEHSHDIEGDIDPHVWLQPDNVLLWLDIVSGLLGQIDPDNAETYTANANAERAKIIRATDETLRALAPLETVELIVTHDSMQYFEDAFNLAVIGAFSATTGKKAGARSTSRLLSALGENTCVVEDTGEPTPILSRLPDGVRSATIDPLGLDLLGAPDYYPRLLGELSAALLECAP